MKIYIALCGFLTVLPWQIMTATEPSETSTTQPIAPVVEAPAPLPNNRLGTGLPPRSPLNNEARTVFHLQAGGPVSMPLYTPRYQAEYAERTAAVHPLSSQSQLPVLSTPSGELPLTLTYPRNSLHTSQPQRTPTPLPPWITTSNRSVNNNPRPIDRQALPPQYQTRNANGSLTTGNEFNNRPTSDVPAEREQRAVGTYNLSIQ